MVDVVTMAPPPTPPRRIASSRHPPIAQAVGSVPAVDYLTALGIGRIARHEHLITEYALGRCRSSGATVIGPATAAGRGAAISFALPHHPHDTGQLLDERGDRRSGGQHCAAGLLALRRARHHQDVGTRLHDHRRKLMLSWKSADRAEFFSK